MSKVRLKIAISLDGFAAGPDQSVEHPLGAGGMQLHAWAFALKTFRDTHCLEGGEVNASSEVLARATANVGATIMGRNMFGGHPGPWRDEAPWNGWWGENPPFHHPVFVLTQYPRERLVLHGDNTFTFVTEGIEAALAQARVAAQGKDISLAGGANTARQYLRAGLVDEMWLHVAPVVLGRGERLFDGVDDLHGLTHVETVVAPGVTHWRYARS